jgi:hypothetical protein
VKLPVDEDDDEEMMRVPEALEMGPPPFLDGEPDHHREANRHDPARNAGSRHEVDLEESDHLASETSRRLFGEPPGVEDVRDDAAAERKSALFDLPATERENSALYGGENDHAPSGYHVCEKWAWISIVSSPSRGPEEMHDSRKVMFFSKVMIALRGPRRRRLMKERQTGSKMRATST